ncbi:hypothetical protein O159_04470 [Leifsonia xyli subsp. cynodontis DSM 46306]|uniref:Uncharacterized protein n=1 Tax=Leifsonia xyli subsp. cynodontis DSM 46306 TaxID=1389489 RepID=U3P5A1_LEIXC|nr:DUF11 domain-containing protein [Leifsonia xyli]AGW40644.1 hypothetical protein O159_04470 [Leifsonia xyli subsp. cynodontis DSM 46306]
MITPIDALEWGFTASEIAWTLRPAGGGSQSLGAGTVLKEGRETVPTTSRMSRTLTAGDDNARLSFGVPVPVESPNGMDFSGTVTTVILRVVDPGLELVKEVCVAGSEAACDVADDAVWSSRAVVDAGADVIWRLTATNTGTIALNDVCVAADVLTDGIAADNTCAGAAVAATLLPGSSAAIRCTTSSLTGDRPANYAKLTSSFTDPDPRQRLIERYGSDGVESNVSRADVLIPAPALALVKQVCETGAGCDATDDAQWVDHATLPLGSDAQWRLTVTNTGNVPLADVAVSLEELSGGMTGTSAECSALTFGTLAAGQSASAECTTTGIADTSQDTVNTAAVTGQPLDDDGQPLGSAIGSQRARAAVTTFAFIQAPIVTPTGPDAAGAPDSADGPDAPAASPAANRPGSGDLAQTGLDIGLLSGATLALLAVGGCLLALFRKRRVRV